MGRSLVVLMVLMTCAVLLSFGHAQAASAERDIEQRIDEARRQIDEAARTLGELYREQYAQGAGQKRAMLGILLPEGKTTGGVEIVGVTPGGGAEAAGLQAGDLIVEMNDLELSATDNPMRALSGYMKGVSPGDEVAVVYERGGERRSATIVTQARAAHMLGMLEEKMEKLGRDLEIDLNGIMAMPEVRQEVWHHKGGSGKRLLAVSGDLARYFDVDEGVVLIEPPADSQLKAGDVLLAVNGEEVVDLDTARKLLSAIDAEAEVQVKRQGRNRKLNVAADEFASIGTSTTRVIRVKRPEGDDGDHEVVVRVEVVD